jgi:hypothetical protein
VNQSNNWTNADIGAFQVAKNSAGAAIACHLLEPEEICAYPNEGLFAQWKKLLQRRLGGILWLLKIVGLSGRLAARIRNRMRGGLGWGKKGSNNETQTPIRIRAGRLGVVACAYSEANRQFVNSELANHEVERNRPLSVVPIVGRLRVNGEDRFGLCGVGRARLE